MSIFNKPYRTDKEMQADEEERRRKAKLKSRMMRNKLANLIFVAVLEEIDNGKDNFSKKEMIEMAAGDSKLSAGEWALWDKACNLAIMRIRRFYWTDRKNVTEKRMFNFVRDMKRYWLIPVERGKATKLASCVVYEAYDRKVRGIGAKMRQIATSAYRDIIELDSVERKRLIKKLRKQKLLT